MKNDPLESLLRLRRLTVDQVRRDLAECLRVEAEAEQAVIAIEAEIERETAAATDLAVGDGDVEAFASWLRRMRPCQRAAEAAEAAAVAETTEARTVLAMARAAARAVEEVLARHQEAEQAAAEHQAQKEIDEAAQVRTSPRQSLPAGRRPTDPA
jgi:flagellar protein FliJ